MNYPMTEIPDRDNEEETKIFHNYYVEKYARYLKKTLMMRATYANGSITEYRVPAVDHYYFEDDLQERLESESLEMREILEKLDELQAGTRVSRLDSLLLSLITMFSVVSGLIVSIFGQKILTTFLPFFVSIFILPFYYGYMKGAVWDDYWQRLKGWEALFLLPILFVMAFAPMAVAFYMMSAFPRTTTGFYYSAGITLAMGLLAAVLMTIYSMKLLLLKPMMRRIFKCYFDHAPTKREKLIGGVVPSSLGTFGKVFIGAFGKGRKFVPDARRKEVNTMLSAMLRKESGLFTLGSESLIMAHGRIESDKFIKGLYAKEFFWFIDLYFINTLAALFAVFIFGYNFVLPLLS